MVAAGQINRRVKRGQVNDADPVGATVAVGHFDQFGPGFLVFEFDFVADQGHDAARGAVVRRADGQTNLGALWAADQLDDLAEFHVHDIHGRFVALGDGDDAVFFIQLFAFVRRAAGNELADGAIAVVLLSCAPMPKSDRLMLMEKSCACSVLK